MKSGGGARAGAGGGDRTEATRLFGIVGHSTTFLGGGGIKKKRLASRMEEKDEEDGFYSTTCAVCMVFVLQYLSTSQLQRKNKNTPERARCTG